MAQLITTASDNYELNPNDSSRFFQFWDANAFGTSVSAGTTNFFDTAGNSNTTKLPSANRFPGGWDVKVWRMSLEPVVVGQTPATALDMNALISGGYWRIMRNSTEVVAELSGSTLANSGGGVNDPGNAASNAQVSTYGMPSAQSPLTLPTFGQWVVPSGQFFHLEYVVSSALTLGASTTLKCILWTELIKPTS